LPFHGWGRNGEQKLMMKFAACDAHPRPQAERARMLTQDGKAAKDILFRFKKQGSGPVFSFIFRFVKRFQLFICFFETFSAFCLL
jgi:hypothetical protein